MKKNKKKGNKQEDDEKPKGQFYTEDSLIDKSLMHRAEFLCFLPQDAIYYVWRSNLLNDDLKKVMRKILGQLNYLLYLKFQEFWATLLYNPSLKKCLESCLTYFNRRKYNQYLREQQPFPQIKDNEVAEYQQHLFKIVLTVYYRILYSDQENQELWTKFKLGQEIYNQWIFDMPKLFDFMDVYASDNPEIVKVMVNRVFEINSDYKLDFNDTIQQFSKTILPKVFERIKFINDREEFDEGINEMQLRKKMEVLMTLKDTLSALLQSFQFFPSDVSSQICVDFRLLQFCENIFYEMYNGYKFWKLGDLSVKLLPIMDSIIQDTIAFWEQCFTRYRQILMRTGEVDMGKIPVKDIVTTFQELLRNFGTVLSLGSKNKDKKRNFMLLERILDRWEMEEFLHELDNDGLDKKGIEPTIIQEFLRIVSGIQQLKQKRQNSDEAPKQSQQIEEQKQEPEPEENQDNAVEQEAQQQKNKPAKTTASETTMPKKPKPITKQLTREQQQLKKRNLARQYDDDYDDFNDYNKRVNDKQESDDTESDGGELLSPNPNHKRRQQGERQGEGQASRSNNYRSNRGGKNYNNTKRGEQRRFDNPRVIEQRNREPPRVQNIERPVDKLEKKKYVEVDKIKRHDDDTSKRQYHQGSQNFVSRNSGDGGKKKYREK